MSELKEISSCKPIREFGCYQNLSNEAYHADKSFLSRSSLMDFAQCPFTYWAKHINSERPIKDSTPQMNLGSAFHTMILEPHLFDDYYAVTPKKVLLKDVGREAYDAFNEQCEELKKTKKIVLSDNDFLTLANMRLRFAANEQAVELVRDARIENSFFWQDEHSGLFLKSRPDILHENIIVDLKTCNDASPRAFQNSMMTGGYHIQGAMIRSAVQAIEGRRIDNVINVCVETKYPYNLAIYILDEAAIDEGEARYKNLCFDLKRAIEENNFKDYGTQKIGLPKWATY